jgi:uracil-DNA glycosylase family 4
VSASEFIPDRKSLTALREGRARVPWLSPARARRIHQTPRKSEIDACMPWLDTEIKLIRPRGLVTLGATAAKALASDLRTVAEAV